MDEVDGISPNVNARVFLGTTKALANLRSARVFDMIDIVDNQTSVSADKTEKLISQGN